MSSKIVNIAKNTSYFTFALILQKVISFSYFTVLARALGPEDLGKYYFAISFTTIFSVFIDIGLSNVLTREIARDRNGSKDFLGSILAIKIPLAIISFLVAMILINAIGYSDLVKDLVYISAICMILDSFTATFFAVIRGFHNLSFESVASIIFQIIVMVFGLSVLHLGFGLRWQMWALALASIFNFLFSLSLILFKWKISPMPVWDKNLIFYILKIGVPFSLFAIFQKIYMYLDSVLLSAFSGDREVGIYQVAFKIIFALQFLPLAFTASLYPAFSEYWVKNKEQLAVTFERAMNYLIIISVPISVGVIFLSDKIVLIFKSGYDDAVLPLQITMASLLFIFVNFSIGSLLNACDRQKTNTVNMGVALVVSVIMNVFLIKRYGATGASITALVTNLLIFVLGIYWAPKITPFKIKNVSVVFIKVLLASFVMGLFVSYFKNTFNVFMVVMAGGTMYFAALFLFGGFGKNDITSVYNSFAKKNNV